MSFFDDDDFLPPSGGGYASGDAPKDPTKPTPDANLISDGNGGFVDDAGKPTTPPANGIGDKGNIKPEDWTSDFEDPTEPPTPRPKDDRPPQDELKASRTPITGFNQQHLRIGRSLNEMIQSGTEITLGNLVHHVGKDLTNQSLTHLFTQGQVDQANTYRSYHFDSYLCKLNPDFARYEKTDGYVPHAQVRVTLKHKVTGDGDIVEKEETFRSFLAPQEGFPYFYPALHRWALKRKQIIENMEFDTVKGKQTVTVFDRLGDAEIYTDANGAELSLAAYREINLKQDEGIAHKRTFEMSVDEYVKASMLQRRRQTKTIAVASSEAANRLESRQFAGFDLDRFFQSQEEQITASIVVHDEPSNEELYQKYRPVSWMPNIAECAAFFGYGDELKRHVFVIEYEPILADEVSRFEHLTRSLSATKAAAFKKVEVAALKALPTPDADDGSNTQAKVKVTLKGRDNPLDGEIGIRYTRALPQTGPYLDIIQSSLKQTDLTPDALQKPSLDDSNPQYQLLKRSAHDKWVLSDATLANYYTARQRHRMVSYQGIPAYPELFEGMSNDVIPFILKDMIPGHYTVESTPDEIKTQKTIKLRAKSGSPVYQGEAVSKVKVFSHAEHMLNSILSGFANTDALFKPEVVSNIGNWEKRFDMGKVGAQAYAFAPYDAQYDKSADGHRASKGWLDQDDLPLNYHYLRRFNESFNHPAIYAAFGQGYEIDEEVRHIGLAANATTIRNTWGLFHSQLLNYTPFYYRKKASDSFKQSMFSKLKEEKKLTADWALQTEEGRFTGHLDTQAPGVKYKGDVVVDSWELTNILDNSTNVAKVPLTRVQAANDLVYYYPSIDAKYGQKDLRFAALSAYAHTKDGSQLQDDFDKQGHYVSGFDLTLSNVNKTERHDWLLSGVYLKDFSLKAIVDYVNSPAIYHNRYRTLYRDNVSSKGGFVAEMVAEFVQDSVFFKARTSALLNKVFDRRAIDFFGHPYYDRTGVIQDRETKQYVLATERDFTNRMKYYLPRGISAYAWDKANQADTDAEYIRYMLDRSLAQRFIYDHTYISDFLNQNAYQRLPQVIHFNDAPEERNLSLEALPNMAFFNSKVNYSAGNEIHQLRLRNFEEGNDLGTGSTPVQIGAVKVITKDDDEKLNSKFTMGYVKPHILESLAISLKEKRDYRIHGFYRSKGGIYKDDANWYTSTVFDGYRIQSPNVGSRGFAELNITMPEVEFLAKLNVLTGATVTETPAWTGSPEEAPRTLMTITPGADFDLSLKAENVEKLVSLLVKDYLSESTGWDKDTFEVSLADNDLLEKVKVTFDSHISATVKEDIVANAEQNILTALFGIGQKVDFALLKDVFNASASDDQTAPSGISIAALPNETKRLTNLLVKVNLKEGSADKHYLYGEADLLVNIGIADSTLNRARLVRDLKPMPIHTFFDRYHNSADGNWGVYGNSVYESEMVRNSAGKFSHSPNIQILAWHLQRQLNPNSDILLDYVEAGISPIQADLSDFNYTYNYADPNQDDTLIDPYVPTILHRYMTPEVRNYLRTRAYDLADKESKRHTYYQVSKLKAVSYLGGDTYTVRTQNSPAYFFKDMPFTFRLQDPWANNGQGSFADTNGVEWPELATQRNTTTAGGYARRTSGTDDWWQGKVAKAFAANYYGYLSDMRPESLIANSNTTGADKYSIINPQEYQIEPKRQQDLLYPGFRPSVYKATRYAYTVEYSPQLSVVVYLDSPQVNKGLDDALTEAKAHNASGDDVVSQDIQLPKDKKAEDIDNRHTRKYYDDRRYYDQKQVAILDFLDLQRYGHTKAQKTLLNQGLTDQRSQSSVFKPYQGTTELYLEYIANRNLNHYSRQAVLANMGRYIVKTRPHDGSVLQSDKTIAFFENKFRGFLLEIGYYYVSRILDTRHLWSGVETYTTPEQTYQKANFKSNALVWFDMPAYIELLKYAFPGIVPSITDSNELDDTIMQAFITHLEKEYDLVDSTYLVRALLSASAEVVRDDHFIEAHQVLDQLPVALMYTRRTVPSFDFYVTVGMDAAQISSLSTNPEDLTKRPQFYGGIWKTDHEKATKENYYSALDLDGDFRGMSVPAVVKEYIKVKSNRKEEVSFAVKRIDVRALENPGMPTDGYNYEFEKWRSSLDMFGHDRMVMLPNKQGPGYTYEEAKANDYLFITTRDDAKRAAANGADSRVQMLSRIVPNANKPVTLPKEGITEAHLALALGENRQFDSEFTLVPAGNHPLYYGEGQVTYHVKGKPARHLGVGIRPDAIWINTTMPDLRTLLGAETLLKENEYHGRIGGSATANLTDNPWLTTSLNKTYNQQQRHIAGVMHKYRHVSDHALPWLHPGLFIAEDANYLAMIHLINALNEDFNENGSYTWDYDFLKFFNPGYQTAGIPFVTLGHKQLSNMIGFTIQSLKRLEAINQGKGVVRGRICQWHFNELVGKWNGNDLYHALQKVQKGQPIGALRKTDFKKDIGLSEREEGVFVEDEIGQIFRIYANGEMRIVKYSPINTEAYLSQARIPYLANLGTWEYRAEPSGEISSDGNGNTSSRSHGWDSNWAPARLPSLSGTERQRWEQRLQDAIRKAENAGKLITTDLDDIVELVGGVDNDYDFSILKELGIPAVVRYRQHRPYDGKSNIANYAVDLPFGPIDYQEVDKGRPAKGINLAPCLLGRHTYETLRDYRFTRRYPANNDGRIIGDAPQYAERSYKLAERTIEALMSGKHFNPAYFQIEEVRDEDYYQETNKYYDEPFNQERAKAHAKQVREAAFPILRGVMADNQGATVTRARNMVEDYSDALGINKEKLKVSSYPGQQLTPGYYHYYSPETDKPILRQNNQIATATGMPPFIGVSRLIQPRTRDEIIKSMKGWGNKGQYNNSVNLSDGGTAKEGERTYTAPVAVRGFYAEINYVWTNIDGMNLLGGEIKAGVPVADYIHNTPLKNYVARVGDPNTPGNNNSFPLHGMLERFLREVRGTRPTFGKPKEEQSPSGQSPQSDQSQSGTEPQGQ